MDRAAPSPPAPPVLVGRDDECRRLDALLSSAASARAGIMLVNGDAGIGKTALVRSVVDTFAARTRGTTVLTGTGLPLASMNVPLLAVRGLVRSRPAHHPGLDLGTDQDVSEAPVAFDEWLDTLLKHGPVVLVLDDLHWTDQSSLDVLHYVVTGPENRPLAILATVRTSEVGDRHPLSRWVADVRRLPRVEELPLGPLGKPATLDQLAALLGGTPHLSLVDDVYAHTAGNPYFTRLLAAGLPHDARALPDTMPSSLRSALLRTWSTLSPTARRGTQVLAVGGQAAGYDALADVAPELPWNLALPEAVASGVVDALPGGAYWFHHPLIAEILESEMPAGERRAHHRAFARWWQVRPSSGEPAAEAARAALVADHWFRAEDVVAARTWAVRAADASARAGAWSETLRLLRRELAREESAGEVPDTDTRGLLHQARAAAEASGDIEAELELIEKLLAVIDPAGDPLAVAELLIRRGFVRYLTGREFDDGDALAYAEELARTRPPSATLVRSMAWRAMNGRWEASRSAQLSEDALALARESDDAVGIALAAKSVVAFFGDDAASAISYASEALTHAVREKDWLTAAISAEFSATAGDTAWSPWFADEVARHRAFLETVGAPIHQTVSFAVVEADARLSIGEWEACTALLRSCMAVRMHPMWDAGARLSLARLAAMQGRPPEAAGHLARAEELIADAPHFAALEFDAVRAIVALAAGDPEAAYAHAVNGTTWDTLPPTMAEWLVPLAARALADQMERHRAVGTDSGGVLVTLRELTAAYSHVIVEPGEMTPWWMLDVEALQVLYRAEIARALNSADAAPLWRVATIRARRARLRWDEAYAGWRWVEALLRSGQRGLETATVLRDSYRLASRLGAAPIVSALERLATSSHISLAEVLDDHENPVDDDVLPGLTPREREIVAHLVAGRTYAEIASSLVISEKTVSSHVSNILRKTGAKNRVDLTVLVGT
ncbi:MULTISPECIES: helix-turn-helix transcriptional regulator [Mumia]|nr:MULTISPECIES: LuxR family transcriptional regulator [Mumia]